MSVNDDKIKVNSHTETDSKIKSVTGEIWNIFKHKSFNFTIITNIILLICKN